MCGPSVCLDSPTLGTPTIPTPGGVPLEAGAPFFSHKPIYSQMSYLGGKGIEPFHITSTPRTCHSTYAVCHRAPLFFRVGPYFHTPLFPCNPLTELHSNYSLFFSTDKPDILRPRHGHPTSIPSLGHPTSMMLIGQSVIFRDLLERDLEDPKWKTCDLAGKKA